MVKTLSTKRENMIYINSSTCRYIKYNIKNLSNQDFFIKVYKKTPNTPDIKTPINNTKTDSRVLQRTGRPILNTPEIFITINSV